MMFWRISTTVRAVLWLLENDSENWVAGSHAIVHGPTGVGIWTANETYGISIYYDIPTCDRNLAHPCNGRQLKLPRWADRKALRKAVDGKLVSTDSKIQRQISDWATDKIRHDVNHPAHTLSIRL